VGEPVFAIIGIRFAPNEMVFARLVHYKSKSEIFCEFLVGIDFFQTKFCYIGTL
jgi:hypothetical protein